MTHYDKIPELLDTMVVASVAEACRRIGIRSQTHWQWIVQSRKGKAELQNITWMEVTAPYHHHAENCKLLAAHQVIQSAVERARDGVMVDVHFAGHQSFKQISPRVHKLEVDLGLRDESDWHEYDAAGKRIPEKQWVKPSDAITMRMLEAFDRKRFGSHQSIDVTYKGVMRLPRDGNAPAAPDVIDVEATAVPILEDDESDEADAHRPLALAAPAAPGEMDDLVAEGAFKTQPVTFVDASGKRTVREATADPLLSDPVEKTGSGQPADGPKVPFDPRVQPGHRTYNDRDNRPRGFRGVALNGEGYPDGVGDRPPAARGTINSRDPNGTERTGQGGFSDQELRKLGGYRVTR